MSDNKQRDAVREAFGKLVLDFIEHVNDCGTDSAYVAFSDKFHSAARLLLASERLSEEEISKKLDHDGIDNFFDKYPVTAETRMKHKAYVKGKVDGNLEAQNRILGPAPEAEPKDCKNCIDGPHDKCTRNCLLRPDPDCADVGKHGETEHGEV